MTISILDIDKAFTDQYRGLLDTQKHIKKQLDNYAFDLTKNEITQAIIERMLAFWHFNNQNNKEILNRKVNTIAADFFTESCLLFLKAYYEQNDDFKVYSEKKLEGKPILRPDISVWYKKELIAVIELKVSNGWKGKTMLPHLIEREEQIKKRFPQAFFGVLAFWNFFDTSHQDWNSKYYGLLFYDKKNNHKPTGANIEKLIVEINKQIKSHMF